MHRNLPRPRLEGPRIRGTRPVAGSVRTRAGQGTGLPPGARRHHRRRPLVGLPSRQDRRTRNAPGLRPGAREVRREQAGDENAPARLLLERVGQHRPVHREARDAGGQNPSAGGVHARDRALVPAGVDGAHAAVLHLGGRAQRRLQAGAGGHQPLPWRLEPPHARDAAAGGAGRQT